LIFLTPIAFIISLIVGYSMGMAVGETIKWGLLFTGMFALLFVFFAYPRGREDWNFSLGETLSMFGIVFIALAVVALAFYICVRYENPNWREISVWLIYIILIIMGLFSVFITLHGTSGLAGGGESGGNWWEGGGSGGRKESKWGVPDVEARYGKRMGWAGSGAQQPKK
jgi:uncharacterized membrane protein